jgi:peptide chain release factor 2
MAYGYLKAENGVHRLVRISPFDANARRHTSFASVEVVPQFEDDMDIDIDERDLEVVTMRSSGAGGQHINKTDSAVRMTHKPTGITVFCQTQRSQLQNRETCMTMLKSKLLRLKIQEQEQRMRDIKGEVKANEWGSQIRSYVFAPYTMVKDLRTGFEVGNIQAVMDGDLDGFIDSYLRSQIASDDNA